MDFTLKDVDKLYRLFHSLDDTGFLLSSKLRGIVRNLDPKLKYFVESLTMSQVETLCELAKALTSEQFVEGLQGGYGAGLWIDDYGKVGLELDMLRVRQKIVSSESELQPLKCSNGSLVISTSAKIKMFTKEPKEPIDSL